MSTEVELDAIEAEVTAWLDANWRPEPAEAGVAGAGRRRRLRRAHVAPRSGSGGSSTATPAAVIAAEFRRPQRPGRPPGPPQPVGQHRAGVRHGQPEAALHPAAAARPGEHVPALLRARRRLRPGRAADPGRPRRRRVGRERPEGVDVGRPRRPTTGCSSPAPTGTCPKHQGISFFWFPMHQPGVEVRPDPPDHRRGPLQRGVHHRRAGAGREPASATSTTAGGCCRRRWPTSAR